MPKFDASAQITAARKWGTSHIVAAAIICFVAGVVIGGLLL